MLDIKMCRLVPILPFVCVLMLAGCAGTLDERRQMKNQGRALFSQFRGVCYEKSWRRHPADFQRIAVTRSRSNEFHTGMVCVTDEHSENKKICSNTYRTELEYYTTEETQDLNKQYRNNLFHACLIERCNDAVGVDAKGEGFLSLRGQKYAYCKQG